MIQPLAAKIVLPAFGGAPAVWNTSLVFFQSLLLGGYAYANWVSKHPRLRPLHLLIFGLAIALTFALGIGNSEALSIDPTQSGAPPAFQLILFLMSTVGLPYFLLSTGAPLLQRWFGTTSDPAATDPYFLYAASNAGSMVGLLAYPFLIEGMSGVATQAKGWAMGFGLLFALVAACAWFVGPPIQSTAQQEAEPLTRAQRLRWVALSAVPSSLLLGVTSYLTTNLASVPLLWIIPLSLYLLTFIIAFRRGMPPKSKAVSRWAALLIAPLALILALEATEPLVILGCIHLTVFFIVALASHSELAESRPPASRLTEFYLWLSVGGVVGGLFNAFVAPAMFPGTYEYPLALIAFLLLRTGVKTVWKVDLGWVFAAAAVTFLIGTGAVQMGIPPSQSRTAVTIGLPIILAFLAIDRPIRYGLSLGAVLVAVNLMGLNSPGRVLYAKRSFFGVHRILEGRTGEFRNLVHGVTIHGRQSKKTPDLPLTYYYPTGPIGLLLTSLKSQPSLSVGIVGLGVGSLAAYSRPQDEYTFFEIDPVVIEVANNPKWFTFVPNAKGQIKMVEGDARLTLGKAPAKSFNVIAIDAFSSDAIPMHLLTSEALDLYLTRIKDDGVVAFHISNRYLSLSKILTRLVDEKKLAGKYAYDTEIEDDERAKGKEASEWFVVARNEQSLDFLPKAMFSPIVGMDRAPLWTDARSNLLEAWEPD